MMPESRHFTLERVADGVYAAIANPAGGAMSNAGIVDLGGTTLVFDTFMTPPAAEDLRQAAEQLTGRPVAFVVNSHWHDDHVRGNQAFDGAEIVATDRTSQLMAEKIAASIERYREEAPTYVRSLEEQYERETDERKRQELAGGVALGHEIVASLATLRFTPPTRTFSERLELRGAQRTAELLTYGGGHTKSDAFLYLPDVRLLFGGDLVVIANHPWMGHGDPAAWLRILDRLEALDCETLVPGHGPVGTRADIAPVRAYIVDMLQLAGEHVHRGATPDEMEVTPIPQVYAQWEGTDVFARNMRFMHDYVRHTNG
jgi:glyoxylase-like metal-dependent hydrolase (beta-lactamase superfamily II)